MNKWTQTLFKDIQRGCLVRIVATAVGLPLAACIIVTAIWAGTRAAQEGGGGAFLLWLALALLPFLLLVGGGVGTAAVIVWRRGCWLDGLFAPLGLESGSYTMVGRQYHGRYRDRQHDIFFYRGPGLLFYVSADTGTRLSAAVQDEAIPQLTRMFNGRPLEHNQPALAGVTIFAHDENWGRAFVGDPAVQQALNQLILGQDRFVFRQVYVWPDAVCLNLYRTNQMLRFDLEAERVTEWSAGLLQLAEAVEKLPPPAERLPPTPRQRQMRVGRLNTMLIALAIVAAILLPGICLAAAFVWYVASLN